MLVSQVLAGKGNLSDLLPEYQQRLEARNDRAFLQALAYGVFRHYYRLDHLAGQLLDKPLKHRDQDIRSLILLGLLQLLELGTPVHAAVSATVSACDELTKPWAKKLVNAILRRYLRESERLLNTSASLSVEYDCPAWLLDRLKQDYPGEWQGIARAFLEHPPLTLRVNLRLGSRQDYLDMLQAAGLDAEPLPYAATAIRLRRPVDVERLPGFAAGRVSVQDEAAQLATPLLSPAGGQRVLDACAAPGGKLAQLLEQVETPVSAVAVEINPARFQRLKATLTRLGLNASLKLADACETATWWDGQQFDRILLDAPCSATGVIRRHPDIKVSRQPADLDRVGDVQASLLSALWPLLKSGGKLLYATCSLLPEENDQQIGQLLSRHADARLSPINADWGLTMEYGRQILPGQHGMDGFYYACIEKN